MNPAPSTSGSASARETAEALSHRCALAVLTYPVVVAMALLAVPGAKSRLAFNLPCLVLSVLLAGLRLALSLSFDRVCADLRRWRLWFRLGVYASALVWVVFAIHEMNANGEKWSTWLLLFLTAGISAGATTSLGPDRVLQRGFLLFVLLPQILWGLVHGGPAGTAVAVGTFVFLVFILIQANHNANAFQRFILDKEALREAGRWRESLVNSIDGIVWEADAKRSRFTFVSSRAETILGYPVDRWLSEPSFWTGHIHPDDRERVLQYCLGESAACRDYSLEYRMVAADGRIVWLRDIVSIAREPSGCAAMRGVMLEVTRHKQASEERRLLAHALLTVREAVTITDLENRIIFVNESFLKLYGYERDELLDQDITMLRSASNSAEVNGAIAAGTSHGGWQGEVWNQDKHGREFPIELSTALVRDEFGQTVAQVGVASDITERKRVEDELRSAKEAAESATRAKSEFLANMSHEIRTPMNGILGMTALLLESRLDPRQRKHAETVRESAESLLDLLNDLLDFSKMEANKLKLEQSPFDLRQVVEGVADLMAVKAQEKGLELLCFIEPPVPTSLLGDASRLRQVLINLVGNAIKFTASGEVSIRVRLDGDAERIHLEVSDTGIGIPPDRRLLLFKPFSQVDASTSRRHGGTGLGLSIVRMLVEMMGGSVNFRSEEGKGSCFSCVIPAIRQPGVQRVKPLALTGFRILVVDDNAPSRALVRELLTFWKARAEESTDGEDALQRLGESAGDPFDAVLIDQDMPTMNGQQLGALIRRQWPQTPMVLLTPLSQSAQAESSGRAGYAGHLTKPVKQGELGSMLASILGYGPAPVRSGPRPTVFDARQGRDRRVQLHLLVVEDNKINREVALGILQLLGYRVDVAEDGQSALVALGREDYDLVLMDCQMPGIDGYEAARRIRLPETPVRNHEIPIIATTAHALAGDREKCMAAGMNGYVAKPLKPDTLERAIEEWTGGPPDRSEATPPIAVSAPGQAVFNSADFVESLMGDEQMAQRIARGFLEDMPRQIALLARALNEGDAQKVRLIAHSIKGASASVYGTELRENARKVEEQGRDDDLAAAVAVLPELSASFEQLQQLMEDFCQEAC